MSLEEGEGDIIANSIFRTSNALSSTPGLISPKILDFVISIEEPHIGFAIINNGEFCCE